MLPNLLNGNRSLASSRLAIVAVVGIAIQLVVGACAAQAASSQQSTAEVLTQNLIGLNTAYEHAAPAARGGALADLVAAAAQRHDLLTGLMEADPGTVLRVALPAAVRAHMPAEVQTYLEQRLALEGELQVLYEDYPDGHARLLHFLNAYGERISLHFKADPPGLLSGTPVSASGVLLDDAMALQSGDSILTLAAKGGANGGSNGGTPAPAPSVLGEQKTLLILVNFQDDPTEPYTVADARSMLFGTTSDFFLENSQQQTWLSGDVAGWFTIASNSSVCDTTTIATQAQAAASAAGFNSGAYAHLVYAFPLNRACGWWGLSSVGGSPSRTWITGDFELGVTAHELGHGMGLYHSHSLDCGSTTLGAACTTYEYGDTLDMMGASSFAHFNAFQKERLGWLNAGVSPPITTVSTDGTYLVDAYESPGPGPKALKVLKSTDPNTGQRTWYYVQSRQAIGFDSALAGNTNVLDGVLILTGTESNGNGSYLLDMTPESGSSIYWDWKDPALVAGQSFEDPQADVSITADWVTETEAAVTVRFGPGSSGQGTIAPPAVTVSTDQPSYTRTQTVDITATVTAEGLPVANAAVSFTVTKANGSVVAGNATTGSNGVAAYQLRLRKSDPVGSYQAVAAGSADGLSNSASTTFDVN